MYFAHDHRQQSGGICIFPCRIAVRKMRADIAHGGGAEQGVDDGVEEHVGIGMSLKTGSVRNQNAAKLERPPLGKAVRVVAMTYAKSFHGKDYTISPAVLV